MKTTNVIGWGLAVAGVLLLSFLGEASLALVLTPAAVVLACGLVWVGQWAHGVTRGLE